MVHLGLLLAASFCASATVLRSRPRRGVMGKSGASRPLSRRRKRAQRRGARDPRRAPSLNAMEPGRGDCRHPSSAIFFARYDFRQAIPFELAQIVSKRRAVHCEELRQLAHAHGP